MNAGNSFELSGQMTMDGAGAASGLIGDTTTADFGKDVIEASQHQTVLVDFWAPWCGPCKQLQPALEKAVQAAGGQVKLMKLNIDEHPAIPGQMGVQSIPAVIAFRDGRPVDAFMGAVPESEIKAFIDKNSGEPEDPAAPLLEAAQAARDGGDLSAAAQYYGQILQAIPDNIAALAGMAETMLDAGNEDQAMAMIDALDDETRAKPEFAAIEARLELARQAAEIGDQSTLESQIAQNADDHQARFDLALVLNAKNKRLEAADQLLEIYRRDREWNEDGARKQLLQFFEAWGVTDKASIAARRKLSSMLFS